LNDFQSRAPFTIYDIGYNNPNGVGLKMGIWRDTGSSYIQCEGGNTGARNICMQTYGGNVGIGTTNPQATLDVFGSIQLSTNDVISTTVSPNSASTGDYYFKKDDVVYDVSASGFTASWEPYKAFKVITTSDANNAWLTSGTAYATTAPYAHTTGTTVGTTVSGTPVYGQWLQIRTSTPVVLTSYFFHTLISSPYDYTKHLPGAYVIAGSNDGTTWTMLQDASSASYPPGAAPSSTTMRRVPDGTGSFSLTSDIGNQIRQYTYNYITNYAAAANSYIFFRLITKSLLGYNSDNSRPTITGGSYLTLGWNPTFSFLNEPLRITKQIITPNYNQLNVSSGATFTGKFGIGTTNPKSTLNIRGGGSATVSFMQENTFAASQLTKGILNDINANGVITGPAPSGGTIYIYWRDGGSNYIWSGAGTVMTFTGQHKVVADDPEIKTNLTEYVGLIVSSNDTGHTSYYNKVKYTGIDAIRICEALPNCKLSTIDNDKAVFGVITNQENDNYFDTDGEPLYDNVDNGFEKSLFDRIRVNSVGEGSIWVTNINGNIENGDYITSSIIPGYGKRQDDDLLHNYTVGKSTMSCDFDINSTRYKTKTIDFNGNTYIAAFIGCSYHCG